jgi:hypothetical protein
MKRHLFEPVLIVIAMVAAATVASESAGVPKLAETPSAAAKACSRGTVTARIAGKHVCLKAGQRCKRRLERQYRRYGFHCDPSRRLRRIKPKPPPATRSLTIKTTGPVQTVFDWTTDRCEDLDIPDLPARAFRGADGHVQLIAAHFVNRRFTGADLDHLTHDCSVILPSDLNPDPAAYDDHEWIAAPYTPDGMTVYALIHDEYHGWEHGQCAVTSYDPTCWYNAITLAVSTDGGASYVDHSPPRLVASVPERYVPGQGPAGVFTPSNIVRNPRDGYYYTLAYVNQRNSYIGNCLLRTKNLADPASWRAWSGIGTTFSTTFVDPYGSNPNPSQHLCTPISRQEPRDLQPNNLTYSTAARQWLLVGQALQGVYFSLSADLITWTPPQLFYPAQVTWNYKCGDPDPIAYPSLIDPASTDRNFGTVGSTAYLYFTQFHYSNCQQTLDRDLVRVPIAIKGY